MSNSIYHYSKLHPGGSSLHNLENLKKYILLFLHSIYNRQNEKYKIRKVYTH